MRARWFVILLSLLIIAGCKRKSRTNDGPDTPLGPVKPPPVMKFYLQILEYELKRKYPRDPLRKPVPSKASTDRYAEAVLALRRLKESKRPQPWSKQQREPILKALRLGAGSLSGRSPFALGGTAHRFGFRISRSISRELVMLLGESGLAQLEKGAPDPGLSDAVFALRASHDFRRGANLMLWSGLVRAENRLLRNLIGALNKIPLNEKQLRTLLGDLAMLERTAPTYLDALRMNSLVMEGKFTQTFDKKWNAPAGLMSLREKTAALAQNERRYGRLLSREWKFARWLEMVMQKDLKKKPWLALEAGLRGVERKLVKAKRPGPRLMIRSIRSTTRRAEAAHQMLRIARIATLLQLFRVKQKKFPAKLDQLKILQQNIPTDPATGKPFALRVTVTGLTLSSMRDLSWRRPRKKRLKNRQPKPPTQPKRMSRRVEKPLIIEIRAPK